MPTVICGYRKVRKRIIDDPALFIKTMQEQSAKKSGEQLNEGSEGKWFKNISIVCHILKCLKTTSQDVLFPSQDKHNRHRCRVWLTDAERLIVELKKEAEGSA